jgi:hypothetical protein
MTYAYIKVVPKDTAAIHDLTNANSIVCRTIKHETEMALSAPEMYAVIKAALDHAQKFPELYIDENGAFAVPWAAAARMIIKRIEVGRDPV